MVHNVKGFFFSLITLFLVLLVISLLEANSRSGGEESARLKAQRAEAANLFISSMESDLQTALEISSIRALLALDQEFIKKGVFVPAGELNNNFEELVMNGSLKAKPINLTNESAMLLWSKKITVIASKLGYRLNMTGFEISVEQSSPWLVNSNINVTITLNDTVNKLEFSYHLNRSIGIDVQIFEDPLYAIGSEGRLAQKIARAEFLSFSDLALPELETALVDHAHYNLYVNESNAPSYLMRLQGDFGPSDCCGIESLVDPVSLGAVGDIKNSSLVDWIYFSSTGESITYRSFTDLPLWFRLDDAHHLFYGVDSLPQN